MENISFFLTIFLSFLTLSITISSVNAGFGKKSKNLLDPFDEHEK